MSDLSVIRLPICLKTPVMITLFLQECDDVSDEKNCKTVSIDPEKYLKSKPPPSIEEKSKLPILLRYDI